MSGIDLTRVSQLIPHVESTLQSYQNVIQSGSELRESNVVEYSGTLEELREMLAIVIQQSMEHEEYDSLSQQLSLHDRITELIDSFHNGVIPQEYRDDLQLPPPDPENKREPIDTHEILDLIEKEEGNELNIPQEDFMCEICYDDIKKEDGFMYASCFHIFCKECLEGYYNNSIMSGDVTNITCPHGQCDSPVIVRDIQQIVSPEMFQKFENFSVLSFLRSEPNARWCPWPACEGAFVGEDTDRGEVNCPTCNRTFCFDCSAKWHKGLSCEEAKRSEEPDDPKTLKWKKKHGVKQCPHCGLDTIRVSGCPDMICSNCKKHWDWFHDEQGEWQGDGLRRKSETKLETAAFVYPRFVKLVAGSRDMQEDPEEARMVNAMVAAIGIAGVPLTLVCGGPALAVRSGRNLRNKFKKRFSSDNV